jgi:hypothetical protein
MQRLINADDILNNSMLHTMKKKDVLELIKNAPTIDAVPVVRGEWKHKSLGTYPDCSVCDMRSMIKSNFCQNCGAMMKEERN